MIGDRMDTGIVAGIEAGLQTILVLSGIALSPGGLGGPGWSRRGFEGDPAVDHDANPELQP